MSHLLRFVRYSGGRKILQSRCFLGAHGREYTDWDDVELVRASDVGLEKDPLRGLLTPEEQEVIQTTVSLPDDLLMSDPMKVYPPLAKDPTVEDALREANDARKEHIKLLKTQVQFLQDELTKSNDELQTARAKHSIEAVDLLNQS